MTQTIDIQAVLDIARNIAGRRHLIDRMEMRDMLERLHRDAGVDLRNDCAIGTLDTDTWDAEDGHPQSPGAARYWANACKHITVISVLADGCVPHGMVRFDEPGSMAPGQRAVVMFYSAEHDPVGHLHGKCERLFLVEGDPIPEPPPPPQPRPRCISGLEAYIAEHGYDAKILDDGILEMRDPNDNARRRHQYTVDRDSGVLLRRTLPAHRDEWEDIGVPEWEAADTPPTNDLLYRYWEELAQ